MRNFRELLDLDYDFFLVLIISILTFVFSTLIRLLIDIILAPFFKHRPVEIGVLGFRWSRHSDGKWSYYGYRASLGFSAYLAFKLDKFGTLPNKTIRALDTGMALSSSLADFIIGAGFLVLGVNGATNIENDLLAAISMIFGISYFVFATVRLVISLRIIIKANSKHSLAGYHQGTLAMIRSGVPMDKMDLKSAAELGFSNASKTEKLMYFTVYFSYLDASGQYDKMAAAVGEVEQLLSPNGTNKIELVVFALLVYYYSYIYIDPTRAKDYYHRGGEPLSKDRDANALRIRGFYELNCFGDVNRAREYADSALKAVEHFSMGSEREYERQCIARLYDAINNFRG